MEHIFFEKDIYHYIMGFIPPDQKINYILTSKTSLATFRQSSYYKEFIEYKSKYRTFTIPEICKNGYINLLKFYCEHKKEINIEYVIKNAVIYGQLNMIEYLYSLNGTLYIEHVDLITLAAKHGHLGTVKYLLCEKEKNNMSISYFDDDDALEKAVTEGHFEIIKYLIEENYVDVSFNMIKLFSIACSNGYFEIVKYLESCGANIRSSNDRALRYAANSGHLEIVKYLVDLGSDIRACNSEAFQSAILKGHLDVVKYIVGLNAVNKSDSELAILNAMRSKKLEVFKYIISLFPNIWKKNIHIKKASVYGDLDIVKYLRELGYSESN